MGKYFIALGDAWHPVRAYHPNPDTGDFHPRPEEVLEVEIGPEYPTEPLKPEDAKARDLLEATHMAWPEGGKISLKSDEGEADFRVQAFAVHYQDMPQSRRWTARLWQTEPWASNVGVN
jgi:hypothetical protein